MNTIKIQIKPGSYASPEEIGVALQFETFINHKLDTPKYQAELASAWFNFMAFGTTQIHT